MGLASRVLSVAAAVLLAGCFEVDQRVYVYSDGYAVLEVDLSIARGGWDMLPDEQRRELYCAEDQSAWRRGDVEIYVEAETTKDLRICRYTVEAETVAALQTFPFLSVSLEPDGIATVSVDLAKAWTSGGPSNEFERAVFTGRSWIVSVPGPVLTINGVDAVEGQTARKVFPLLDVMEGRGDLTYKVTLRASPPPS